MRIPALTALLHLGLPLSGGDGFATGKLIKA